MLFFGAISENLISSYSWPHITRASAVRWEQTSSTRSLYVPVCRMIAICPCEAISTVLPESLLVRSLTPSLPFGVPATQPHHLSTNESLWTGIKRLSHQPSWRWLRLQRASQDISITKLPADTGSARDPEIEIALLFYLDSMNHLTSRASRVSACGQVSCSPLEWPFLSLKDPCAIGELAAIYKLYLRLKENNFFRKWINLQNCNSATFR